MCGCDSWGHNLSGLVSALLTADIMILQVFSNLNYCLDSIINKQFGLYAFDKWNSNMIVIGHLVQQIGFTSKS